MGGVAIENWGVSVADLSRVVKDDDLSGEILDSTRWLVLRIGSYVSTLDILDRDVLDVESNIVSGKGLSKRLVVHLDGLALSCQLDWGEGDERSGLQDSGLNTVHGHCSNSANFVNILKGQTKGLVGGSLRGNDGVETLQESDSTSLSFLALHGPSLVPGHVGGGLDHVVAVKPGNGHEGDSGWVVPDLLDEAAHFLLDLLEPSLGVWRLSGVHLVNGNDELLDTKGVGQQGMLSGLTILGDTSLKLTSTRGNDEHSAISLGGSGDHVLDEIPVTRGIDDGDVVLGSFKLPESDIDGDSTFTLSLQFVENPRVLEGALAHLLSL